MADSDIRVTALTASQAGPGAISVMPVTSGGSCLPYLALSAVEIWGGATNSPASFTKLGDTVTGFLHGGLAASTTRYYRARARDASNNYGDWYPSSGSVSATTSSVTPGPNSIGETELKDGAVTDRKVASIAAYKITTGTLQAGVVYAGVVQASQVNAQYLSALSANLGTVTAGSITGVTITGGTITGATIQTSSSGPRTVLSGSSNTLIAFDAQGRIRAMIGEAGSASGAFRSYSSVVTLLAEATENYNDAHAIRALNTASGGGHAVLGISANGGGWALNAQTGGVYSAAGYKPFTGQHEALIPKAAELAVGDIVCDVRVIARGDIDNTLTEVAVAEDEALPAAIGVLSERRRNWHAMMPLAALGGEPPHPDEPSIIRVYLAERYDLLMINALGEGQINVCGRGGDIAAGDLIVTSTLPGKGMRQADDIVRSFTVAKAREAATFSGPDEVRQIACIYLCG